MIISQARAQDEKDLANVQEIAAIAARLYAKTGEQKHLDKATQLTQFAEKLKDRVNNFDYSEWDKSFRRVREMDREFEKVYKGQI